MLMMVVVGGVGSDGDVCVMRTRSVVGLLITSLLQDVNRLACNLRTLAVSWCK